MTVIYPATVYDVRRICDVLTVAGLTPRFYPSSLSITVPCSPEDLPAEVALSPAVAAIDHP